MNKTQLAEAISAKTNYSKKSCLDMINASIDVITAAMKKNDPVQLIGFGTFGTSKRAARKGKNPQTGEAIKIPAAVVPKFKPGKALKDAVNKKKK